MPLTPKQARFVAEFLKDSNGTQAAIRAGYSKRSASEQAYDLLRKPQIAAAIAKVQAKVERSAIATRQDRQEFWTRVLHGEGSDIRWADRLKASELLGKSEADFTDKLEHSGEVAFTLINPFARPPG